MPSVGVEGLLSVRRHLLSTWKGSPFGLFSLCFPEKLSSVLKGPLLVWKCLLFTWMDPLWRLWRTSDQCWSEVTVYPLLQQGSLLTSMLLCQSEGPSASMRGSFWLRALSIVLKRPIAFLKGPSASLNGHFVAWEGHFNGQAFIWLTWMKIKSWLEVTDLWCHDLPVKG